MKINPELKIILDADVLIHFINGEQTGIINKIFKNELVLLDKVFEEVFKRSSNRVNIENLIKYGFIKEERFEDCSIEIKIEYYKLVASGRGKGESAGMAYCRYTRDALASSNLKDIIDYCKMHNIVYITTMDFIAEAFKNDTLKENECDEFIKTVKQKGGKLIKGIDRIRDYITR